ncbi:MAG: XdhC family protein [Acidimicrobiales bacterium]
MKELIGDIDRWHQGGQRVALARVVGALGSGTRVPGAAMAVSESGEAVGSIAGGCVEGAVVAEALEVITTGEPQLRSFGYSDEEAMDAGLTCGGAVQVFVELLKP